MEKEIKTGIASFYANKVKNGAVKVFLDSRDKKINGLQEVVREIVLQDEALNRQETYDITGQVDVTYKNPFITEGKK